MNTDAVKHLVGKEVIVLYKGGFMYRGKVRPGGITEGVVKSFEQTGIILDDDSFQPWANIASICPATENVKRGEGHYL